MFIFVEGFDKLNFDLGSDIQQVRLNIDTDITFSSAVQLLALYAKPLDPRAVILFNFFTKGCRKLLPAQRRGLERIALGDNAIEICRELGVRKTRFLLAISAGQLQKQLGTLRAFTFDKTSFGIGNFSQGNILLVGEQPGPDSFGFDTPFVGSGSGIWLLRQLESNNIDENELYWINAKNAAGVEAEQDFVDFLKPRKIITLGTTARVWAKELSTEFKVITVYHPQYWRRFKAKEAYPLIPLLK